MEVNCWFYLVLGGSGAWQPWARVWQVLANLERVRARFGTPGQGPGKSWDVQDWSWQHQDWSWQHQDLPRTCPGKVQHSTKTSPPYQNEIYPLHLRFSFCIHSYSSPPKCFGSWSPKNPPVGPGGERTSRNTKKFQKYSTGVRKFRNLGVHPLLWCQGSLQKIARKFDL